MTPIKLTWTWELESPLHHGSGLSRPGTADRLIQRDKDGNPFVTGDAVKGALRMSAEQLLAWQSQGQVYEENKTAEPRHELLQCIFGGKAQAHFEPARAVSQTVPEDKMTVAATAIDRQTGCAKDNTLRTIEVLPKGAQLESKCEVWVGSEEKTVAAFLLASLAATEWLGGRTGAGWGRVKPLDVAVLIGTQPVVASTLLDSLKLDAKPTPSAGLTEAKKSKVEDLVWHKLTITLTEPTCLGNKPAVANTVETLDSIPATTLRGALAAAWLRSGKGKDDVLTWLGDETRWTPAYPSGQTSAPAIPVPMSFMVPKHGDGLAVVHDTLTEVAPKGNDQWRKAGARWMSSDGKTTVKLDRETTMHVARDYETGSKRDGALYSRAHLEAKKIFVAWALLPKAAFTGMTDLRLFLGKRTTAGHGAAEVTVNAEASLPTFSGEGVGDGVTVQLLSPAIVRGTDGYLLRSLDVGQWNRLLGCSPESPLVERVVAKTAFRDIPGWMSTWQHGRAAVTAIEAGSVWKLIPRDSKLEELREALKKLVQHAFGERGHEGFGWLVVDPPWLGKRTETDTPTAGNADPVYTWPTPAEGQEAQEWPGSRLSVKELESLYLGLKKLVVVEKLAGPLQALATLARDENATPDTVYAYLGKMTGESRRPNQDHDRKPGAWEKLKLGNPVRAALDSAKGSGLKQLRFAIEALLIKAGKEAR